jgi:hypothetical protein
MASFTRLFLPPPLLPLARDDHLPVGSEEHPLLRSEIALDRIEERLELAVLARRACDRERRALPEVVMVHLRDRDAEPFP